MGFLKKAFGFVVFPSRFRTILVLSILLGAVSLTVILAQQQQSIKQRASDDFRGICQRKDGSVQPDIAATREECFARVGADADWTFTPIDNTVSSSQAIPFITPIPSPALDCSQSGVCTCEQTCRSVPGDPANCLAICNRVAPTSVALVPTSPPISTVIPTTILTATPIPTSIPVPTVVPTNTSVPTAILTTLPYCYLKSKGDANCDGNIDDKDFNIWVSEFKGISTDKSSDFDNKDGVTIVDFNIWRTSMADSSLPH